MLFVMLFAWQLLAMLFANYLPCNLADYSAKVILPCKLFCNVNKVVNILLPFAPYNKKGHVSSMPSYESMVRPHLVYCIQFWSIHLKKEIKEMEKV